MKSKPEKSREKYYVIARRDGDRNDWPVFNTSIGNAVAVFASAESAWDFRRERDFGLEWGVVAMMPNTFLRLLRCNLLNSVPTLLIDPPTDNTKGRSVPIFRILVEVERD